MFNSNKRNRSGEKMRHRAAGSVATCVLLTAFSVVAAVPVGAAGSCPLPGARRYYFLPVQSSGGHYPTTTAHRIGNSRYGFQTNQSISGNPLPAGTYTIRLGTYDPHHAGGTGSPEPDEQWHAEFLGGTAKLGRTARTPDLNDRLVADSFPMGHMTFTRAVTLLRGVHDPVDPEGRHGFVVWFVEFSC
jgi:hypothetical protein